MAVGRMNLMSRIRILLAWLVMAAIPLQGFAAASMLFCGPQNTHHAQTQAAAQTHDDARHGPQQAADHDHSRHGDGSSGATQAKTGDPTKPLPDVMHKCGICASCCNLIAIATIPELAVHMPAPQAEPAEPFVLIHARPSTVPDKPPRV